ncbi:MAG TPA: DNA polymerase Y family protein, partial [Actinospica sp.]|nr:DNA polymerase Y family protein [Actinospica sp.]
LVPDEPYPAALLDARGARLGVTGRARLTGRPAVLVLDGVRLRVADWAGPWPYYERPWRAADSRRRARLQVAVADGRAFLLALEQGDWRIEGVYQ